MLSKIISSLQIPDLDTWEGKFFIGILGFSWTTYLWEEYLSYRQRKVYTSCITPPVELKEVIDEETFNKARIYGLDKSNFGFIEGIFNQVLNTGIMLYGGFPFLWNLSGKSVSWFGLNAENEILQTIAFVVLGSAISSVISLPWSAYFTFKVEQKHGFNKQDKLKKFVVLQFISSGVVAGLVKVIKIGGNYFFVYLWGFTTLVMLFFMTVYPDYIAPLFDKYEPLPDGELKESIEKLAASITFPLTKLYVVEGSKRSAHSNAYLYGFFKNKRIVLYDTLLEEYTPLNKESSDKETQEEDSIGKENINIPLIDQNKEETNKKTGCNNSEVVAVLGHELGHWKLNHVLKGIAISQVNLFLVFGVFQSLYSYIPLYRAFGFKTQPAFIGLIIVMQFVFAPYNEILNFLMTMFSRYNEFQADAFAKSLGYTQKLKSALIKLNKDNLDFPVYDWLFSAWHHSHPPLIERLKALDGKAKVD